MQFKYKTSGFQPFSTSPTMKTLVIFSCLLVAIHGASLPNFRRHANIRPIFPNGKIVGGSQTDIKAVPWQIALEDGGYLFCGGSIISVNFVLTAAHCTDGSRASDITVRYGTRTLESGGQTVKVSAIHQNPGFTQQNLDYDVSVLRLANPITLSDSARAVSLRSKEAATNEGALVSGWGTLHSGDFDLPPTLYSVVVPVVARNTCNSAYDGDITARMICAGEAGKDSCQGDSGGAITIDGVQVGIVSWGYGCAAAGYPGVYTNAANQNIKDYITTNSNNEAKWV